MLFSVNKNGTMELDADEPRKFRASQHGWGGWPVGRGLGEGKSEDSLWRRDLSALGPFGAEANFFLRQTQTRSRRTSDKGLSFLTPKVPGLESLGLGSFWSSSWTFYIHSSVCFRGMMLSPDSKTSQ